MHGSEINKEVTIPAGSNEKIILSTEEYKELSLRNPKLWWPHTVGKPTMHEAQLSFTAQGEELDRDNLKYGIREIQDYYTDEGHRGFMINGEKVSVRGGGWVDNIMLDNTHAYDLAQLEYVKSMNLNTIRLEGFWGKDDFLYQMCDELGILIMVGWSCHWEWEDYLGAYCDEKYGGILSDEDIDLMSVAWKDQIAWLRNHPSIFAWFSGSDCVPAPALEEKYMKTFAEYDSSRIYLSSAKEWESSDIQTGMKMRGPYAYVPPVYWYSDTLYGGAFGFNTETGPGAQVPPLESIKKMIPEEDLWPINDVWDYHCGRHEFNTLDRFTKAMINRYGAATSVDEYARKAQLLNYELMRPMFEAFSARRYRATGVIQWMLNSAWPEMYWQLYDSYLMPNAAFYATKKAGESLHALYDYHENSIYVVNDRLDDEKDILVIVRVFNIRSEMVFNKEIEIDIPNNSSLELVDLPQFEDMSETYFLDLRIEKAGNELSNNFYWLSTKADELDYEAVVPSWNYHTLSKAYANFDQLNTMEKASVSYSLNVEKGEGSSTFTVEVENLSVVIAFFIEMRLVDDVTGNTILPVLWSDNYISLSPLERRIVSVTINNSDLEGINPQLLVEGINLE
jgi:exo-1,4-beta-D-glucosaminidase